jgi:hypothetical protein
MSNLQISPILIAVIVVALLAIVIVIVMTERKRRSEKLKQHFGPEYDRLVQEKGGSRHAEAALAEREKRVDHFTIRELPSPDRERYSAEWGEVQRRFVDDPTLALVEADRLVTRVMEAKGYPMADFEQRAADISVHYPGVVTNYRSGRAIVLRQATGTATTEEMRQAMMHYRSLFDELLGPVATEMRGVTRERIAS